VSEPDEGSRLEAAEAGLRAEAGEAAAGHPVGHHVTATDLAGVHPHRHHPLDENLGVAKVRLGRGAALAGTLAALLMLALLVALGIAIGSN